MSEDERCLLMFLPSFIVIPFFFFITKFYHPPLPLTFQDHRRYRRRQLDLLDDVKSTLESVFGGRPVAKAGVH